MRKMATELQNAAAVMGRKGGQSRSLAKVEAARRNAKLGGRPPIGNAKDRRRRARAVK